MFSCDSVVDSCFSEFAAQESGKYAENRRGKSEMSMLDEVTAEAVALAEVQTQAEDLPSACRQRRGRRLLKWRVLCGDEG